MTRNNFDANEWDLSDMTLAFNDQSSNVGSLSRTRTWDDFDLEFLCLSANQSKKIRISTSCKYMAGVVVNDKLCLILFTQIILSLLFSLASNKLLFIILNTVDDFIGDWETWSAQYVESPSGCRKRKLKVMWVRFSYFLKVRKLRKLWLVLFYSAS